MYPPLEKSLVIHGGKSEMSNHVFIIAEAGVNHNGDINLAKRLIEEAAKAGADAVKFQTFKASKLVTKDAKMAVYQEQNTGVIESQYDMLKKLELDYEDYPELIKHCEENNIQFMSSPFDIESLEFLSQYNLAYMKIGSGEITNIPLLRAVAKSSKRVILSTGMSNIGDIERALLTLSEEDLDEIILLHCNTEYPTPYEDVNLNVMKTLEQVFAVRVGYSDHTIGIEVPIAAVALGATVIEKHFTLDKHMEGPDHKASLESSELKQMVQSIRNIEKSIGSTVKTPTQSEIKNRDIARKSIVASRKIIIGESYTEENLTVKRPGTGISPVMWDFVIGRKAIKTFEEDELIEI